MSRRIRRRLRRRFVPLALALTVIVVAIPFAGSAAAKGPIFLNPCAPVTQNVPGPVAVRQFECVRGTAVGQGAGDAGGTDAGIVAAGAALLALTVVGGVLVAIRRRAPQPARPAPQH